jgi:hypothetical protein
LWLADLLLRVSFAIGAERLNIHKQTAICDIHRVLPDNCPRRVDLISGIPQLMDNGCWPISCVFRAVR